MEFKKLVTINLDNKCTIEISRCIS